MNKGPLALTTAGIQEAWMTVMGELLAPGVERLTQLTVTITGRGEASIQGAAVQEALDRELIAKGLYSSHTTANTIFPRLLWRRNDTRAQLFVRYARILPILKKADRRNKYGIYFERLIAFDRSRGGSREGINQLDHIVSTFQRGNTRRSALQAAVFDPVLDLNHQRQRGFPCLQYVTFDPNPSGQLEMTGVYTTQYIFDRGYGNYLGLYGLGEFMAHEMSLSLDKIHVVTMRAEIGSIGKGAGRTLLERLSNTG